MTEPKLSLMSRYWSLSLLCSICVIPFNGGNLWNAGVIFKAVLSKIQLSG